MINKLLNMINYENQDIRENITFEGGRVVQKTGTFEMYFKGVKPLPPETMKNFMDFLDNSYIVFRVNKISYDFTFIEYDEEIVEKYFIFILRELSEKNPGLIQALDYQRKYDSETKKLTITTSLNDANFSLMRNTFIKRFKDFGLKDVQIAIDVVNREDEIKKELEQAKKKMISDASSQIKKTDNSAKALSTNEFRGFKIHLKELPNTVEELEEFKTTNRGLSCICEGELVFVDQTSFDERDLFKCILKQDDDYYYFLRSCRTPEEKTFFKEVIGAGKGIPCLAQGYLKANQIGDVNFQITNFKYIPEKKSITNRVDEEPEKRVELHLHTQMTSLDGVNSMSDYIKAAEIFGHKAIAVTDYGTVQSYHDLHEYAGKHPDFKPLFGLELNVVDEETCVPIYNPQHINLDDATYVVFDLEATGLSHTYDRIIEVSAVKYQNGIIIDRFSQLVNPEMEIHSTVVNLTGITNQDVKNKPTREEVLPRFKKFIDGCILVAHNASYDTGLLYKQFKTLNIEFEPYPCIDTLVLARILYPERKYFGLEHLCNMFKVTLNNHHRAMEDATATGECFLHMLLDVKKHDVRFHDDINTLIDKERQFLYVRPKHINLLAKNHDGLINIYHLLSLASTTYFNGDPTIPIRVLNEYREGILVGSGCRNSLFWDTAFYKTDEAMEKLIQFYDYIEVQPLNSFLQYRNHMNKYEYQVTDTIKRIIQMADKYNIPVCATGDVHQINPEDQIYRKILVDTPRIGGKLPHLLNSSREPEFAEEYYMTTREMLDQFKFLPEQKAYQIVVTNPNNIANACEVVKAFTNTPYPPLDDFMRNRGIPSAEQYVNDKVYGNAKETFGDTLPGIVEDRIKKELDNIFQNKFSTVYLISDLLVQKSWSDGYVVGSRGSVGSSYVAFLMGISEVNSLPPHYRCPKCRFSSFRMTKEQKDLYGVNKIEEELQKALDVTDSGYDLPDANCPLCGTTLERDGQDIPFETFLGVPEDPKTPDIDLNFSGENQGQIHEYIRELFGQTKAFRAGTIITAKDKTSYSIVKDYFNKKNEQRMKLGLDAEFHRKSEIEALSDTITGSKKTSSQHPGGIVVVPEGHEIYEITPVQYPGDSMDKSWMTTHFDYHSFEKNLFKLDVLGQDDPTVMKYLMKYVNERPERFPFSDPFHIPVNDGNVYQMMNNTTCINVYPQDIDSTVATYGISEFGTPFVRGLLEETRPKTFAELIKISGLSHGTGVWRGNSQDLVNGAVKGFPKIPFKDTIGCRDDIMVNLIHFGVPSDIAFRTMEFVRKGKPTKEPGKWLGFVADLEKYNVPKWYIWSCGQIQYMFPKAHACAYVISALRIAWFKYYKPAYFYSAILSKKLDFYDVDVMSRGLSAIRDRLKELKGMPQNERKEKENKLIITLELCLEMTVRGIKFIPIDLMESEASDFKVSDDEQGLYIPFSAVDSLGLACAESIVAARKEKAFSTQKDFMNRTQTSKTLFEKLKELGVFNGLQEDNQLTLDLGI